MTQTTPQVDEFGFPVDEGEAPTAKQPTNKNPRKGRRRSRRRGGRKFSFDFLKGKTPSDRKEKKPLTRFDRLMASASFVGAFFLVVFIGFLAFQSMHIYAELGRMVGAGETIVIGDFGAAAVRDTPLVGWLLSQLLRGLAAAARSLEITMYGIVFIMLFIVLQTAELAPSLVRSSPHVMANMIATFEKFTPMTIKDSDDDIVARLKDDHNTYYTRFIAGLDWARTVAYCIDLGVCVIAAPIIQGGYSAWSAIQLTFGWGSLDYANIFRIFITLFFLQWVFSCFLQVVKGFRLFSKADT